MDRQESQSANRDASALLIMGVFFMILGALVLCGAFWAIGNQRALVVDMVSGTVLAAIGAGTFLHARRLGRNV